MCYPAESVCRGCDPGCIRVFIRASYEDAADRGARNGSAGRDIGRRGAPLARGGVMNEENADGRRTVAVVGAGIAGLAAGVYAQQSGFDVHVFE